MSMGQAIESLLVKVGGDISEALNAYDRVAKGAQKMGAQMTQVGATLSRNVTAPIIAAGAAALAASVRVGLMADELFDLEQQTGLSVEQLQEFRHVAIAAGDAPNAIADAAIKLTARLSATGEESKMVSDAFSALGMSTKDSQGNLRSMDELLPELITRLQGVDDITARNALTAQIFGRGFAGLAPILGMTAEEMEALRAEAHELGLVLDRDALTEADKFRESVDRLKEQAGALTNELGIGMIPVFRGLADVLQQRLVPMVRGVLNWLRELDPVWLKTVAGVLGVVAAIGPLILAGGHLLKVFALILTPTGLVVAALASLAAITVIVWKNWDVLKLQGALAWAAIKGAVLDAVSSILGAMEKLLSGFPFFGRKVHELRESFDRFANDSLAKSGRRILDLERAISDAGVATDELAESNDRVTQSIPDFRAPTEDLKELTEAEREAKSITESMRTPYEVYADTLKNLKEHFDATRISAETFGRAAREATKELLEGIKITREKTGTMRVFGITVKETGDKVKKEFTGLKAAAADLSTDAVDAFASFALGGKAAFRDFVDSAIRDLARLAARALAFKVLSALLGAPTGGFGAAVLAAFKPRAMGGPVSPSEMYLVGERGPELFVPRTAGSIVPNGGGGPGVSLSELVDEAMMRARPPAHASPEVLAQHPFYHRLFDGLVRGARDRGLRLV